MVRALLASGLLLFSFSAASSHAALFKYEVRETTVTANDDVSPNPMIANDPETPGVAVIDNAAGSGSPILQRLAFGLPDPTDNTGLTISAPSLSGFIWLKSRVVTRMNVPQTGTGNVTSTVQWGDTTGWTEQGGQFCHSVPSFLCDLAMRDDNATVPPIVISTHYDLRAWSFHPTGFIGEPYIFRTTTSGGLGNSQRVFRGLRAGGGEVPAVPLLALGTIAMGLVAAGVVSVRRGR